MNAEIQTQDVMALDTFQRDFAPGSIKKAMDGVKSRDLWQLEPQRLRFLDGFNTRVEGEELTQHIRELADSMKKHGFYLDKPISILVAQEGESEVHYVTDGHCRVRAALIAISEGAQITKVSCVTEDRSVTLEDLTVKLFRSNTGKPLSLFETGLVCKRLLRYGWDEAEIAHNMGLEVVTVNNLLMLMGSPKPIRDAVIANVIAATEAIKLLKAHGGKAVAELEKMQAKALQQGKKRVTASHAAGAKFKKAMKKHGDDLYGAAQQVKADPAFTSLSEETRSALETLLEQLELAKVADVEPPAEEAAAT